MSRILYLSISLGLILLCYAEPKKDDNIEFPDFGAKPFNDVQLDQVLSFWYLLQMEAGAEIHIVEKRNKINISPLDLLTEQQKIILAISEDPSQKIPESWMVTQKKALVFLQKTFDLKKEKRAFESSHEEAEFLLETQKKFIRETKLWPR